jgi:hypothetical protein
MSAALRLIDISDDATLEVSPVERLNWRTLMSATDDTPKSTLDALDAYFAPFAQPLMDGRKIKDNHPCLKCGKPLTGLASMFLGGGFAWGIAHGEGHCSACHWPARAHHFIKADDGSNFATIRHFVLQYHPDFVKKEAR